MLGTEFKFGSFHVASFQGGGAGGGGTGGTKSGNVDGLDSEGWLLLAGFPTPVGFGFTGSRCRATAIFFFFEVKIICIYTLATPRL